MDKIIRDFLKETRQCTKDCNNCINDCNFKYKEKIYSISEIEEMIQNDILDMVMFLNNITNIKERATKATLSVWKDFLHIV